MNCPLHIREKNDPKAEETRREREELRELEILLAGEESDFIS